MRCNHEQVYFNSEHSNYYCKSCKQGMGLAYYQLRGAIDAAKAELSL